MKGHSPDYKKYSILQHVFISSTHARCFNWAAVARKKKSSAVNPQTSALFKTRDKEADYIFCLVLFCCFFFHSWFKAFLDEHFSDNKETISTARNHVAFTFPCSVLRSFSFWKQSSERWKKGRGNSAKKLSGIIDLSWFNLKLTLKKRCKFNFKKNVHAQKLGGHFSYWLFYPTIVGGSPLVIIW